jgi:hypothetical protein
VEVYVSTGKGEAKKVMANPKGLRNRSFGLGDGCQVMIYSSQNQIFLQLRREIPTETDVLQPSFKVAVSLSPAEALALASELLQAASGQIAQLEGKKDGDL